MAIDSFFVFVHFPAFQTFAQTTKTMMRISCSAGRIGEISIFVCGIFDVLCK